MPLKTFRRLTSRRREPSGINAQKPPRGRPPRRPQPLDPSISGAMGTHAPRASPAWRDEESPCALSLTTDSVDSFSSLSSMSTSTSTSAGTGEDPDRFVHPRRSPTFGFIKSSPTVNVYTTCGRHTDQLLFGGPSLSGFARAFLKPALKDG